MIGVHAPPRTPAHLLAALRRPRRRGGLRDRRTRGAAVARHREARSPRRAAQASSAWLPAHPARALRRSRSRSNRTASRFRSTHTARSSRATPRRSRRWMPTRSGSRGRSANRSCPTCRRGPHGLSSPPPDPRSSTCGRSPRRPPRTSRSASTHRAYRSSRPITSSITVARRWLSTASRRPMSGPASGSGQRNFPAIRRPARGWPAQTRLSRSRSSRSRTTTT